MNLHSQKPSHSFPSNKKSNESQLKGSKLKQAELLFYKGNLNEALKKLVEFENREEKYPVKLQSQILKSLIFTQMGDTMGGLNLSDQIIEESQQIGNLLILFDANVAKASALFELGELNTCLEVIKTAENIIGAGKAKDQSEFELRDSKLKFLRGKVYRKKGELDLALGYLQESFFIIQEYGSQYEKADILNILGIVHASRSENDSALEFLKKSLEIFEDLENRSQIIKLTNNIGMIHWLKGELDQALEYYKKSLFLSEDVGNKRYRAVLLSNIGLINRHKGDLNSALDYFEKGLEIYKELESKSELATFYNNIGGILEIKGELNKASEYYQKSFTIAEELGDKQEIATSFNNIGNIYKELGEKKEAINYYEKSLFLYEELGNNLNISQMLFLLVMTIEESDEHLHHYFQKLQQINSIEDNKLITQFYRFGKAIILRKSDRIIQRAEAQQLLQEIVQEEIINIELTFYSTLYLCESLLLELRISGDDEIINEVYTLLKRFHKIAKEQYSYHWLAQIYWLESRLALLELDMERSQRLLTQAISLAKEKDLRRLAMEISREYESFIGQISRWEQIVEQKPSMEEVIELTQLGDLIDRMITKRIYRKEEEIIDYAAKAKELLERWGEFDSN